MQTIYWHDYETFGADPQRDLPCQFAGVRTDLDLNIIDEPVTLYCQPAEDYLPAPEACFVTGITPQEAKREGVVESEFAQHIFEIFSQPQTCVAGYNSIRFDDEVSRHMFYRNFIDPYQREWANGNSRWDLIDVVRLVHALRPATLNWPKGENGAVSFRLELLTQANGISHEAAHDAMSDVYATIALAKLIKAREPKLFDWAFGFRSKNVVAQAIDLASMKPLFHVSSKFPVAKGCCALVAPMFEHPTNKNAVVMFDLRQDPRQWLGRSSDELKSLLYSRADELAVGQERPAIKAVHINKCPVLLPASSLKQIDPALREQWLLDEAKIREHLEVLRTKPELIAIFKAMFESADPPSLSDPDLMLYSGGFWSPSDKAEIQRIRSTPPELLGEEQFVFQDARLEEMLFRFRARNYSAGLDEDERERWQQHCQARVLKGEQGFLGVNEFMARLASMAQASELTNTQRYILEELQLYAESILPYG